MLQSTFYTRTLYKMVDTVPMYGANIPEWLFPFNFVPFLLLGAINGLLLGMIELNNGGVSDSLGFGGFIGYSIAGIVSLYVVDFIRTWVFPRQRSVFPDAPPADTFALSMLGMPVIIGGALNGLVFWYLHTLAYFQFGGFFVNAVAGAISLTFYSGLAMFLNQILARPVVAV